MTELTFQRLLQSVLFDNKYDRFVSNRRSGTLDTKKLRKISYSDKFFKKKEERKNKEYSIALVVDCSGSMLGDKAQFAFESARLLSKNLSAAKVNHAVYGFHSVTDLIKDWNTSYDKEVENKLDLMLRKQEGFWDSNSEFMCKRYQFTPKFKENGYPESFATSDGCGFNNDGYALRYIAKELHKQSGTKLMIVLSDGEPAYFYRGYQVSEFPKEVFGDNPNLNRIVNDIIKSGIELHSIGIMSDAVNEFYPSNRTCSIYDLSSLYDHIIKIIKLNMKRV